MENSWPPVTRTHLVFDIGCLCLHCILDLLCLSATHLLIVILCYREFKKKKKVTLLSKISLGTCAALYFSPFLISNIFRAIHKSEKKITMPPVKS